MAIRVEITAGESVRVGTPLVVEGAAPKGRYSAVFEDDGDTGYFYALDAEKIQDAVHIYNVKGVSDRDKPSAVAIGWSADSKKAILLINDYPHAVFDFAAKQGYCRTGFPPSNGSGKWSSKSREWQESVLKFFE